jgi:hypothetical protein
MLRSCMTPYQIMLSQHMMPRLCWMGRQTTTTTTTRLQTMLPLPPYFRRCCWQIAIRTATASPIGSCVHWRAAATTMS